MIYETKEPHKRHKVFLPELLLLPAQPLAHLELNIQLSKQFHCIISTQAKKFVSEMWKMQSDNGTPLDHRQK